MSCSDNGEPKRSSQVPVSIKVLSPSVNTSPVTGTAVPGNLLLNDTLGETSAADDDIQDASDNEIEDGTSIQSLKNSPPVFNNKPSLDSIIYLSENAEIGYFIFKISATDPDGDRICAHIANSSEPGVFTLIDGVLTTARSLDFETHSTYNLTIMITDGIHKEYWPVSHNLDVTIIYLIKLLYSLSL